MSVLAEFDQIEKIKVAKEKENMQRIEITIKSNNQEAVSITSEKINYTGKGSGVGHTAKHTPLIKQNCLMFYYYLKEVEK